jgi:hypothetical protein
MQAVLTSCSLMVVYSQLNMGPFRADVVGTYVLPNMTSFELPRACFDFSGACAAEATGQYEKALQLYEDKYPVCGDHGWKLTGHAQGSNDYVTFKVTPCGLHVAIKQASHPKECLVMKQLTQGRARESCPGCFPQYYYLSNATQACYAEFINASHIAGISGRHPEIHRVKLFYLQSVHAVKTMREQGLEHRDLSLRNILVRYTPSSLHGQWEPHIVFIDFGATRPLSDVVYLDAKHNVNANNYTSHKWKRRPVSSTSLSAGVNETKHDDVYFHHERRRLSGNGVHTDLYSLTCAFYASIYHDLSCHGRLPPEVPVKTTTIKYAFAKVMNTFDSHTVEPDYAAVAKLITAADTF